MRGVIVDEIRATAFLAVLACLLWAAIADVRWREIPDAVPLALLVLYAVPALGGAAAGVWWGALLVAGAVFAGGAGLFALGALGGGDVKLLAATALWAGPLGTPVFLAVTAVAGGVLAAGFVLAGATRPTRGHPTHGHRSARRTLPYAVAIAVGGLWTLTRVHGL